MKKKTRCRELVIPLRGNRTFLAMKYLLIFLFAFHLNGFSGIKAQQVAEYRVENANLKTCIKKVEQLTGKMVSFTMEMIWNEWVMFPCI